MSATQGAAPGFTPVVLRTPRLTLRFLTKGDEPALYAIFSDPAVMRYWATTPWTALAQAEANLTQVLLDYGTGSALRLGIVIDGDDALAGTCTIFGIHRTNRRAEIGYALAQRYWGHGYMQEALGVFLAYAFGPLDLHRIEADIDPRNAASARTLERQGFRQEGLLRERWIVDSEVSDSALYGLLAREFKQQL